MKNVAFFAVGIILAFGIGFSHAVDDDVSVRHPYTSLTRGALFADADKTKELLEAAAKTYEALLASNRVGTAPFRELYPASKRWMEIEVDFAKSKGEARSALANHASRMDGERKRIEAMSRAGVPEGVQENLHYARFAALEAEILLLNAGGKTTE